MGGSTTDKYPYPEAPVEKAANVKANVLLAPLNHLSDNRTFSQGRLPENDEHPIFSAPSFDRKTGGKLQKLSHNPMSPNIVPF